jgi:hypothetical protein
MSEAIRTLFLENVQPRPRQGAWHGGPTAVGAVRGVSARQAAWRPAPGRKNIWDLVLHVAYWNYAVRRRLGSRGDRFPRSPANWPRVRGVPDERAWSDDVALLRAEHDRLVEAIGRVPLKRYAEPFPGGKRWTLGELILGIAQHDAYHVGQIQMLKRLWTATRPPATARRRRQRVR